MPRWLKLLLILGAAVLAPFGVFVLYAVPPTDNTLYPKCLFHLTTGLHCPGCGTTRCLHALLNGDPGRAFSFNPLFMVGVPLVGLWWARGYLRRLRGDGPSKPLPTWALRCIFVTILLYWVARNIPYEPFTLLAPQPL